MSLGYIYLLFLCSSLSTMAQIPLTFRIRKDFLDAPEWLQRTLQIPTAIQVPFQSLFLQKLVFHGYPERVEASDIGLRCLIWVRVLFVTSLLPILVFALWWLGGEFGTTGVLLIGAVLIFYLGQAWKRKWPHVPERVE